MANYFNIKDLVYVIFIECTFSASQNSIYQLGNSSTGFINSA